MTVNSTPVMTLEQRMERIDTLLCILFSGLVNHPMAKAMIPENELAQLRALLPQDTPSPGVASAQPSNLTTFAPE
jgi:hypothetical protein